MYVQSKYATIGVKANKGFDPPPRAAAEHEFFFFRKEKIRKHIQKYNCNQNSIFGTNNERETNFKFRFRICCRLLNMYTYLQCTHFLN